MTKNSIKKKTTMILIAGILILLCTCLICFYDKYNDNKFRKEISKIQDDNVYNKDILKATDILYNDEQTYLRLENIANILNSSYKEDKNKSLLKSNDIKLELTLNSKKAKLNEKKYILKQKIIKTNDIRFISKDDIENIYNVVFDENSLTLFSKYSSKILIIKAQDEDKIIETKPIKLINKNKLYIAKYNT